MDSSLNISNFYFCFLLCVLWIYSEKMLGVNSLSKLTFYLVNIYLLIYEFVKHVEMVEIFYNKKEDTYMIHLAKIMNYLVIEKKLNYGNI